MAQNSVNNSSNDHVVMTPVVGRAQWCCCSSVLGGAPKTWVESVGVTTGRMWNLHEVELFEGVSGSSSSKGM